MDQCLLRIQQYIHAILPTLRSPWRTGLVAGSVRRRSEMMTYVAEEICLLSSGNSNYGLTVD